MIMPSLALWVSNAQIIKLNKLLFRHYSATDVTAFGNRVFAVCVLLKHNEAQKKWVNCRFIQALCSLNIHKVLFSLLKKNLLKIKPD